MSVEISELQLLNEKGEVADLEFLPYEDSSDHMHKKAHMIRGEENDDLWHPGMVAQDVVDSARLLGAELTALCGYKWVPKHDPDKHDICSKCLKIWEAMA